MFKNRAITLTDLRYLIALAEERHFGRAAELCFVSQPTLSVAIKKVEDELQQALFERHRHDVIVTPAGQKIIEQAKIVLREMENLGQLADAARDEFAEPLRLGAIFTSAPDIFPALIRSLKQAKNPLLLYLEENYTHVLTEKLASGELDAIIVAEPFDAPETQVQVLFSEEFLLLMPSDHPWCERRIIPTVDLADPQFLLLGEGHCFRDQMVSACPQVLNHAQSMVSTQSLITLRHMVASGLGLTMIPASAQALLTAGGDVCVRPLEHPPVRRMVLAWRRRFPRKKALQALSTALLSMPLNGVNFVKP